MNILFWADGFWPRIGGTETQGFQFVQEMQRRGHQCTVIAQKDSAHFQEEEVYQGISIRRFEFDAIVKKRDLKTVRLLRECLENLKVDVVYLNTFGNGSAFAFLLSRPFFSVPIVTTVHAPYYGDHLPPLVLQLCEGIDQIVCASHWGYAEMKRILPEKCHPKLCYIPYGLRLPEAAPKPLPFSPPTILLLGRLSSEKGFEVAIEAFSFLQTKAKLLVVGEGDERPFLEHLTKQLGIEDSVQFLGGISRDHDGIFHAINQATFTVMPSHMEAFGLVALESMRMGRPVIASNVGGLREIVSDGKTGRLVPPNDPLAFCQAMQEWLDHPEELKAMGERAYQWAMHSYLLEDHVNRYEEVLCIR